MARYAHLSYNQGTSLGTTGFDREHRTRIASRGVITLVNQVANITGEPELALAA